MIRKKLFLQAILHAVIVSRGRHFPGTSLTLSLHNPILHLHGQIKGWRRDQLDGIAVVYRENLWPAIVRIKTADDKRMGNAGDSLPDWSKKVLDGLPRCFTCQRGAKMRPA